ncbi:MAG: HAD family hydrolase [Verrucomicrobia bacterium]|nr:HAD family hydrolase [Verrucomicrobiota bacterium]
MGLNTFGFSRWSTMSCGKTPPSPISLRQMRTVVPSLGLQTPEHVSGRAVLGAVTLPEPNICNTATTAFARYEAIKPRLPSASFPSRSIRAANLESVSEMFDAFVLDAFGVLNIGDTAIPGAVERMQTLRKLGKRLMVLTNAASYTQAEALAKYSRLGFDFSRDEVISSRDVAAMHIGRILPSGLWGAIAAKGDTYEDIPANVIDLIDDPARFARVDGFLFLSTARWTADLQARLENALRERPRPLVIANPDLVAPREAGLSPEPGLFAHDLIDMLEVESHWFGKPFAAAFDLAA